MTNSNPLASHLADWLPAVDVAVLDHGFTASNRDYNVIIQDSTGRKPGTYRLTFTHVVRCRFETRVRDDVWAQSWSDIFTNYTLWETSGEPEGYVWGTNWSLAYPGIKAPEDDQQAATWSRRLGKPMYAMSIETDKFFIDLIFHAVRIEKLSDDAAIAQQVIMPL